MSFVSLTKRSEQFAFVLLCAMPLWLAVERVPMEVSTVLISVLLLLHSVLTRNWLWLRESEMKWLLGLWLYLVANVAWRREEVGTQQLLQSFYWLRFVLLYAAMRFWLLATASRRGALCRAVLTILTVLMVDGFFQYVTGHSLSGHAKVAEGRLTGLLRHPNLGNLLLKLMLVAFAYVLQETLLKRRAIAPLVFLGVAFCVFIPLTGERSITLLLLLGVGVLAASLSFYYPAWRKRIAASVLCGALLAGGLGATQPIIRQRADLMDEQLTHFAQTPYGQLFSAAVQLWQAHPLFGVGKKHFFESCLTLQQAGKVSYCDVHPHNLYLQWLAEQGLVGTILFAAALFFILRRGLIEGRVQAEQGRLVPFFALAAMVILLFPFVVTQSHFSNWPALLFWYSLALAMTLISPAEEAP